MFDVFAASNPAIVRAKIAVPRASDKRCSRKPRTLSVTRRPAKSPNPRHCSGCNPAMSDGAASANVTVTKSSTTSVAPIVIDAASPARDNRDGPASPDTTAINAVGSADTAAVASPATCTVMIAGITGAASSTPSDAQDAKIANPCDGRLAAGSAQYPVATRAEIAPSYSAKVGTGVASGRDGKSADKSSNAILGNLPEQDARAITAPAKAIDRNIADQRSM